MKENEWADMSQAATGRMTGNSIKSSMCCMCQLANNDLHRGSTLDAVGSFFFSFNLRNKQPPLPTTTTTTKMMMMVMMPLSSFECWQCSLNTHRPHIAMQWMHCFKWMRYRRCATMSCLGWILLFLLLFSTFFRRIFLFFSFSFCNCSSNWRRIRRRKKR